MDNQFSAELTDFKMIYNVLKAISFKEFAILRPLEEGLKITLEEMRCVETTAYIPSNLFTSYHTDPNEYVKFKLNVRVLTECLHIYGDDGNPSLKMIYKGSGHPLSIVLKHDEENVTVDCEINTLNVDDSDEISLGFDCSLNKIVVSAGQFHEILSELDNSSDVFELMFSPNPGFIRITTTSTMGESQTDIRKDSEIVTLFQCENESVSKYAYSYIRQFLKVMSYSSKVSISTGESGLLGIQLAINTNDKQIFVEYYVTAMFEDDN